MIRAGIIGATGYTGIELVRLLQQHPTAQITHAFTASYAGQPLAHIYPHLKDQVSLIAENLNFAAINQDCDIVFISLPHGHASEIVQPLLKEGKKIIDLGADFRLKNAADYQHWYQHPAPATELLQQAVYGLPEKGEKDLIRQASLIANPGCYPTATILATLPALRAGIIDYNDCIYDAKSGVSGAGRVPSLNNHFCEITENLIPYQVAGLHRHTPEIEQELGLLAKQPMKIQFTPHLVPIIRGLLVTAYFKLTQSLSQQDIHEIYQNAYQDELFIRVCPINTIPQVKHVRGTNYCDIGMQLDVRTNRLIVVSAIDNLIKGAAGQAIQNMNLMYGLAQDTGLKGMLTTYP